MLRPQFNRPLLALPFVVALLAVAACGDRGRTTIAPTASPSVSPSVASKASGASGATILGTVAGISSTPGINPQSSISIVVTVSGSAAASTVDGNGHFTLNNVPAGHVDLHFTGNGVDAHLGLDGVSEHATIVFSVRISGRDARLEDDHRQDDQGAVEVEGPIAAGSLSGSCAGHNLSFTVGTTRVTTNSTTQFKDGRCESLKAGTKVEVKGARQSDNSVLAATVEGGDEGENDDKKKGGDDEHDLRSPGAAPGD